MDNPGFRLTISPHRPTPITPEPAFRSPDHRIGQGCRSTDDQMIEIVIRATRLPLTTPRARGNLRGPAPTDPTEIQLTGTKMGTHRNSGVASSWESEAEYSNRITHSSQRSSALGNYRGRAHGARELREKPCRVNRCLLPLALVGPFPTPEIVLRR